MRDTARRRRAPAGTFAPDEDTLRLLYEEIEAAFIELLVFVDAQAFGDAERAVLHRIVRLHDAVIAQVQAGPAAFASLHRADAARMRAEAVALLRLAEGRRATAPTWQ